MIAGAPGAEPARQRRAARVLMLLDRYWPHVGGSEAMVKTICDLMDPEIATFTVLTRNFSGSLPRDEIVDGVPVVRRGRTRFQKLSKVLFLGGAVAYLIRRRGQYDVVHVTAQQYDLDLLAVALARLVTRKPYIIHIQRSESVPWMLKLPEGPRMPGARPNLLPASFFRRMLQSARGLLVVDQETIRTLDRLGFPDSHYVPNAVRVPTSPVHPEERAELRRKLDLPPDAAVACTVGVLRPEKNHITLLGAWRTMLARWNGGRPARLVLLGGAQSTWKETESMLRAYVAEHDLDTVEFRGSVPNVADFLRASDLYVHPSLVEGTSLAIIEAMSSGLPVVVSDIPGNRDLVATDADGLLFNPTDVAGLASQMERALGDESLRRRLGARAQERAKAEFGVERALTSVASAYARAVAERPQGKRN